MDDAVRDRTLKRFRLDPRTLGEIITILSRGDRRAVVKADEQKIDDPALVSPGVLGSAKEIDISSYWINPEHPTWGRRHFVYVLSNPIETRYFGDSMSPEVLTVLRELDTYFGTAVAPRLASATGGTATASIRNDVDDRRTFLIWCVISVIVATVSFFVGRWSVDDPLPLITPDATPMTSPS